VSKHGPSFISLFRRGHYARFIPEDDNTLEAVTERLERERFAAACIGFCLKHSKSFRDWFWERVCRVDDDPRETPDLEVEIEPVLWADLRVSANTDQGRIVWVIECKAGAPLRAWQNPDDEKFVEAGVGYGDLICAHEKEATSRLRYVVLGAREQLSINGRTVLSRLKCFPRAWACLVREDSSDSLERDLLNSLGELGISCFRMKELKAIRIKSDIGPVAKAWDVLKALGPDMLNIRPSCWTIDAGRGYEGHFNFGAYLLRPPAQKEISGLHLNLAQRLNPSRKYLAWAGYESGSGIPNGFRRSVWLYCSNEAAAKNLCDTMKIKLVSVNTEVRRDEDYCAIIWDDEQAASNDLEWFKTVLETGAE
jgi:hypothetical protein